MLPRDERRFKAADINGDVAAEREEFTAFLHPEEFEHMQEIVVLVSVTWIMEFGFQTVVLTVSLIMQTIENNAIIS